MRVGFDAKRALNNATGLGNYSRVLLNALMRENSEHDYLLFSPSIKDGFLEKLEGIYQVETPQKTLDKLIPSLWRSLNISNDLMRNRIHIFHGLSNEIPLNSARLPFKKIVTIHDLIFLKHKEQYPLFDRKMYELKTRYAAKHADIIIAVSEETKRDLMDFYKTPEQKIKVIYPSCHPDFQKEYTPIKADNQEKYILNVGSFVSRKNQLVLIKAFNRIKHKVEENLWLVGKGKMQNEVVSLIHNLGLEQRVKLISETSHDELLRLYRGATLFVYPSLMEGFGIPVLEALFSGLPVVASQGGAIEEAAGKNAVFVQPHSEEDIAEKIVLVLSDKVKQKTMVAAGFLHAQTMTTENLACKTLGAYQ